jgi:hypothetical protein
MKQITEIILSSVSRDFFTTPVLMNLLPGSDDSRKGVIKRALASGEIVRLRRGVYILGERYRREKFNSFELARLLCAPSYVSFESALSFHGIIPEHVATVASASTRRSVTYSTPLGVFQFSHVGGTPFLDGVQWKETSTGGGFLIASPERALIDLIGERKLRWVSIDDLAEGYRMDLDALKSMSRRLVKRLAVQTESALVVRFVEGFLAELKGDKRDVRTLD